MKKLTLSIAILLLIVFGCAVHEPSYYERLPLRGGIEGAIARKKAAEEAERAVELQRQREMEAKKQEAAMLNRIQRTAREENDISVNSLEKVMNSQYNDALEKEILAEAVEKNWLPFERMFHQFLQKGRYSDAEQIGKKWYDTLQEICWDSHTNVLPHSKECARQINKASSYNDQITRHLLQNAKQRGFLTIDQMEEILESSSDTDLKNEIFVKVIETNLLPFRGMFYLALEKDDYEEAELVRLCWINYMERIKDCISDENAKSRIQYRLKKLDVVGLTDSMLVGLRKDLAVALSDKKWDDANKIQDLITKRVAEIKPPTPPPPPQVQPIIVQAPSVQTQPKQEFTFNVPSVQKHEVQRVPRYGFKDVGRALSLIDGKGGRLTSKQLGILSLFDIITGR